MNYCKEFRCWVEEIEAQEGHDCQARIFGEGCTSCMNLYIVDKKKQSKDFIVITHKKYAREV